MSYAEIVKAVEKLKKRYCENDPFRLCEAMGIKLIYASLGAEADAIKGFFFENRRIKTITINADLPYTLQKLILCHELGHAMLHRKNGIYAFHDFGIFDVSGHLEQEANIFAAELLLDDEEILQELDSGMTFFQTAANLDVPVEVLDFKLHVMKWKGYDLKESPVAAPNNFLADIEIPQTSAEFDW